MEGINMIYKVCMVFFNLRLCLFSKYIFTVGMYMNIKIQDILKKKYLKYKNKVENISNL